MAIEHVLHAHSRAITDINWHTTDPNQVVSTGIDGWLWGWDIRRTNKPVLGEVIRPSTRVLASSFLTMVVGLSAFNGAGDFLKS